MTVDNRIQQRMDFFAAEQMILHQSVASLQTRQVKTPTVTVPAPLSATLATRTRQATISRAVAAAPAGWTDDDMKQRLQALETKVTELTEKCSEQSQKVDQCAFESLRNEMKQQLQSIKNQTVTEDEPEHAVMGYVLLQPDRAVEEEEVKKPGGIDMSAFEKLDEGDQMDEMEEMRHALAKMEDVLDENNRNMLSKIERKSESSLMERMFEKLRMLIANSRDEMSELQRQVEQYVSRVEMEEFVTSTLGDLVSGERAAAAQRPFKCLSCGKVQLNQVRGDGTSTVAPGDCQPSTPSGSRLSKR
jgi:hypothetical protein